jgi:WD40 repeat protein
MTIDKHRAEIARLTGLLCEGIIAPAELERLEALLLNNPESQRVYHQLVALRVDLSWTPVDVMATAAPVPLIRAPGRRAWKKWLARGTIVATAMAAAIVLAVWLFVPPPPDDSPAAHQEGAAQVVALYGEAKIVSPSGDMRALSEGQEVAPGQIVSTGTDDCVVTLEYPDATRLILGADTLAQLPAGGAEREFGAGRALGPGAPNPPAASRRVFLFKGFLRAEVPGHAQAETRGDGLLLASAHAEVAAAASFVNFWTSAAETRVESERGQLKLTRRSDRHAVDVLTNSYVVVTPEQPELKPLPMPVAHKPRRVFKEGNGPVVSLAFTADGKMLAVGGWKGQVQFLDVQTGEPARAPLRVANKTIRALAFSPNRRLLATAADEKERIKVWDLASDAPARVLKAQRTMVRGLAFAGKPAVLVSGAGNNQVGELRLWQPRTGAKQSELAGHGMRVMDVAVAGDGKLLATVSKDRTARIWDVPGARLLRTLPAQQRELLAVALTRDGQTVATAGQDGSVVLWDPHTGEERRRWQANSRAVKSLAFSPDGRLLATAGNHPAAKLWDTATGNEVAAFRCRGHVGCVVRFTPDGRTLAVADWSGHVTFWDVP